jgi:hypothetical protein
VKNVTFELSTPVKVVALAGLILVLAAGAFASYTVAIRHKQHAEQIVPAQTHAPAKHGSSALHFSQTPKAAPKPIVLDGNLPRPVHQALRSSREVVAVLTAPNVPGDSDNVTEAALGARAAHVGFTVLDVTQETVAETLAAWAPNAADGSVLVVRRPGKVAVELDGYADRQMVAQAALDAQ